MKHGKHLSRRTFLRTTGSLATLAGLGRFSSMNALAQTASTDYKALVCIFLYGGNDSHNMVVPQTQADFNAYKAARGTLALPDSNAQLLSVSAANGTPYGLNSGLSAIQQYWGQKKLAVVANTGVLISPMTRAQYLSQSSPIPFSLFSHEDQQISVQTDVVAGGGRTGWAARAADTLVSLNGSSRFPAAISTAGQAVFCAGNTVQSASLIPGYDLTANAFNYGSAAASAARKTSFQEVLALDTGLALVQQASQVKNDALNLSALLKSAGTAQTLTTAFPSTDLGNQLKQVAQIISLRAKTGINRQVFFCSLGGFDTHENQSAQQLALLTQLAQGMNAMYNATIELGLADKVTMFTESDFGRTLQPSGTGSDHGWGSHHLVMGGAVNGGDVYGTFPSMALSGPDDSGDRGALIPSTSIDQYGATLSRWFGVSSASMSSVFPNIGNFAKPDLGFMS